MERGLHDPSTYEEAKAKAPQLGIGAINRMLESMRWTPNLRILDYGCGPGSRTVQCIVPYAEKWNCHVVGVDCSPEMVEYAKHKSIHPRVEYHVGNLFDPTPAAGILEPGSYDKVLCNQVLHYLKPHKRALVRMAELLSPGGQLGLFNMSKSLHYTLLDKLAIEAKFSHCLSTDELRGYIPTWIEQDVDFEQDLRSPGSLPPDLKIVMLETVHWPYPVHIDVLTNIMYAAGPLTGKLNGTEELEAKEWYRQQLEAAYEPGADRVVGHPTDITVGVLEKTSK